ncbi:MAG: hypothetical protein PHN56_02455 [Candidatus Nanoarchaeia archaeon]|nr:hypothetical protein [Candidatus Nanoarchaeia archaeon]
MGFEFNTFIAQASVVLIVLITTACITTNELKDLINGIELQIPNMAKLMVNVLMFIFVSSIFLIPSVRGNVNKIINKPLEYSIKLLDKFMK